MTLSSNLGAKFKAEFAGKIIAVFSGAALTILLARLLSPDDYGLLFLAISVFGIVELFSKLGIAKSAARYITEYNETNPSQIPHIINFSIVFNIITIAIVCAFVFIFRGPLSTIIGEPELEPLFAIGTFFIGFVTLKTFARKGLQGFEAIIPAAILHAIESSSRLIISISLVIIGYGVTGALVGYVVSYALTAIIGILYIYHHFYCSVPNVDIEVGLRRRIAEYTIPLTFTSSADVLDKHVDTILVGFFVGPIGVAYYAIGKQVVQFIETPMSALGFTLSPTYEAQKAKGNIDIAARIYEEALTHGLLLYIPAAIGLILVSNPLVELVFGEEYLGSVPVLQVMALYAVVHSSMKITSSGLDFLGRARDRAIAKGVTALLNVVLNIVLIPWIGVVGAAISTVITYSIYSLTNIYIIHTELNLRIRYITRFVSIVILITAIMAAIVYYLTSFITGFTTLFAVIGIGGVTWAMLAVGTGLLNINNILSVIS